MNRAEAIKRIQNSRFAPCADFLVPFLRPTVTISRKAVDLDSLSLGASRMGGVPDLPEGIDWPHRDGRPLDFLVQINLSDIADKTEGLLPNSGWLYFFFDDDTQPWGLKPSDYDGWKVLYVEGDSESLKRCQAPEQQDSDRKQCPCSLSFESSITIPSLATLIIYPEVLQLRECADFGNGKDPFEEAFKDMIPIDMAVGLYHQLLGHEWPIQGSMNGNYDDIVNPPEQTFTNPFTGETTVTGGKPVECEEPLKSLLLNGRDWHMLLQLDTDEEGPGWMWGDTGRIYFWMPKKDLLARNFDNVWLQLQCS